MLYLQYMKPEHTNPAVEESNNAHTPNRLHQVTPLSKYLAMTLFIILPFLGGWIGYEYAPEKVVEREIVREIEVERMISLEPDVKEVDSKAVSEVFMVLDNGLFLARFPCSYSGLYYPNVCYKVVEGSDSDKVLLPNLAKLVWDKYPESVNIDILGVSHSDKKLVFRAAVSTACCALYHLDLENMSVEQIGVHDYHAGEVVHTFRPWHARPSSRNSVEIVDLFTNQVVASTTLGSGETLNHTECGIGGVNAYADLNFNSNADLVYGVFKEPSRDFDICADPDNKNNFIEYRILSNPPASVHF